MRRLTRCLWGLLLLPAAAAAAPPGLESFVLLEKEALLLTPPRLVTTGMAARAEWSPDGRYVLAGAGELPHNLDLARPPAMKGQLVLWSASTGEAKTVWSGPIPGEHRMGSFAWFSRGDAAAVLLDVTRPVPPAERRPGVPPSRLERWLYRLEARAGTLKPLTRVPDDAHVTAASGHPAALVWAFGEPVIRLVRSDGRITPVAAPKDLQPFPPLWLEGGTRAAVGMQVQSREGGATGQKYVVLDTATGQLSHSTEPPNPRSEPAVAGPVQVVRKEMPLAGVGQLAPIWLTSTFRTEKPQALLAPDSDWATLSPDGRSVLFGDSRGVWVVKPLALPKEAFLQARLAAERSRLLTNGKQLALGLMMYAQDHDERLPAAEEAVNNLLQPYLKTEALFEGFTYTYGGGPLSEIAKPAEQVLGYVQGPGGRALLYADGHVTWQAEGQR